jgi:hypothetical protein
VSNYRKIDSYCGYSYEIIVTNIGTDFGKAFVINVFSTDPNRLTYGQKYISFEYDTIDYLIENAVRDVESYIDGIDYSFDEKLKLLKFDII